MKKNSLRFAWTFLLSIVFAGLTAQNVPVNLNSGWNWISYPRSDVMSLEAAMEGFTPASGDVIKSMGGSSMYQNGKWQGSLTELVPGEGYMYYSASGQSMSFVFGGPDADPSMLPVSALEGEFTVRSNGTKVRFSPGNLQYRIDPNQESSGTLGSGTTTDGYMPYATYYKYSLCQLLYTAEELHAAGVGSGSITGIAFESSSGNQYLRDCIEVWMSATSLNNVSTTSVSTSGMTRVFSGSLTQQLGWTPLNFSMPFAWNGSSNVLITVVMNHGTYDNTTLWKCNELGFTGAGYARRDDSGPYLPSLNTYTLTTSSKRPNTRFVGHGGVKWRFAENQNDYIGEGNANASSTYSGWIDLFCWGTSGHPHGAVCYQPWSTSTITNNYYAYGTEGYDLFDQTGEADWGCNAISNGGDQPLQWRTLTGTEWTYLLNTRTTASGKRYAKAKVGGVKGLILLPDDWSTSYYTLSSTNSPSANFTANVITNAQWPTLEQHGAVFLPAAGYRLGTVLTQLGDLGHYWSSSFGGNNGATMAGFNNSMVAVDMMLQEYAGSVRLVCQTDPRVRTLSVNGVGCCDATVSGEAQSASSSVTERGFCWNTTGRPTLNDGNCTVGTGAGSFSKTLSIFSANTTYYIRSFAKIGGSYRYGNEIAFTTKANAEGALPSVFSVSATQKVQFSQGNLQYQASTDTWRFAGHQWDVQGQANLSSSATYDGWIDLFCWATSGWNPGNTYFHPWEKDGNRSQYGPPCIHDLTGEYANCDWGHNPISNGNGKPNQWRTLTRVEMNYLCDTRTTSSGIRFAKAKVYNVNGVILLPDDWETSYFALNETNNYHASYSSNTISYSQWMTLEEHGVVFLPAAGYQISGSHYHDQGENGEYWTSSAALDDLDEAYATSFSDTGFAPSISLANDRNDSYSVRLVRDVR